jgi:ABC-2 type transport system permease protein
MSPVWHLFTHELRRNFRQSIAWTAVVAALVILVSLFIPTIVEYGEDLTLVIEKFPKTLLAAFGLENAAMIATPVGYFALEGGRMITILGSIFAASLGANLLLKEQRDRTSEFLLAQPLSRLQVWAGKTAAAYVYVIFFNAMTFIFSVVSVKVFSPVAVDVRALFIFNIYVLLLTMTLTALGLFLSAIVRRGRSMTGTAIAIALGGFFVDAISKTTRQAHPIGYLSPYRFIDTSVLDLDYGIKSGSLAYFLLGNTLLLLASALWYRRKDIVV